MRLMPPGRPPPPRGHPNLPIGGHRPAGTPLAHAYHNVGAGPRARPPRGRRGSQAAARPCGRNGPSGRCGRRSRDSVSMQSTRSALPPASGLWVGCAHASRRLTPPAMFFRPLRGWAGRMGVGLPVVHKPRLHRRKVGGGRAGGIAHGSVRGSRARASQWRGRASARTLRPPPSSSRWSQGLCTTRRARPGEPHRYHGERASVRLGCHAQAKLGRVLSLARKRRHVARAPPRGSTPKQV